MTSVSRLRVVVGSALVVVTLLAGITAISGTAAADDPFCVRIGYDGSGTSGDPFQVDTVDQLQCINEDHADVGSRSEALGAHYEVTSDIDASGTSSWNGGAGFFAIGDSGFRFQGTFDGNGHVISGLTIDQGNGQIGLFGFLDGATIRRVGLHDVSITGRTAVGGLVGVNDPGSSVSDSYVTGDVTATGGFGRAGGLVGNNEGTVSNSYATADVSVSAYRAGGLVGFNRGTVEYSYATGAISGPSDIGGLVGLNYGGAVRSSYWDAGTTDQAAAVGANVNGGTTTALTGYGSTGDTAPAAEMQGSSASTNMDELEFPSTWTPVESGDTDAAAAGYPILTGLDRLGQLQAQGIAVPSVESIARENPTGQLTNADSVEFAVTFSESVSGVDGSDFTLSTTDTATTANGDSDIAVSGSGSRYTVTVATVAGDGDLRLDLVDDDSISDTDGNTLVESGPAGSTDGSYTSGETYTIDNTQPTVASIARSSPTSLETNADSVEFTVTFSESVTGISTSDFSLSGSASGSIASVSSASGSTITVTVDSISTDGTLGLNAASGGTIADLVGNSLDTTEPGTDESYTVDTTAPGVSIVTLTDATDSNGVLTTGNTVQLTATVTDSNTISAVEADASAFDAGTVTLADDGPNSASTDDQYSTTITVGTASAEGKQSVTVSATDGAGNGGSQAVGSGSLTVDTTAPVAVATSDSNSVEQGTAISFDASGSSDNDAVASSRWDFGDGTTTTGRTVTHTYEGAGTYTATLTVTDIAGNTDTATLSTTVESSGPSIEERKRRADEGPPTAEAGENVTVEPGQLVVLDGSNSTDDMRIVRYRWDYTSDGTTEGNLARKQTVFGQPGVYTATLTVEDEVGKTDSDTVTITVRNISADNGTTNQSTAQVVVSNVENGTATGWRATVSNARANETVEIPAGPVPTGETDTAADRPVDVSGVRLDVNADGDFRLGVTTTDEGTETGDSGFERATGARPLGSITVDHTIADTDIGTVTFTVRLTKSRLEERDASPDTVSLYREEPTRWNRLPTTLVDETATHYVYEATSPGLSVFTVAATGPSVIVTDVRVTATSVEPGEPTPVTVTVANRGEQNGTYTATLTANDSIVAASQSVDIVAGSTRRLTLDPTFADPGTYTLSLGGEPAGEVTVRTRQPTTTRAETVTSDEPTPTTATRTVATTRTAPSEAETTTSDASGPGFGVSLVLFVLALCTGTMAVRSRRQ